MGSLCTAPSYRKHVDGFTPSLNVYSRPVYVCILSVCMCAYKYHDEKYLLGDLLWFYGGGRMATGNLNR